MRKCLKRICFLVVLIAIGGGSFAQGAGLYIGGGLGGTKLDDDGQFDAQSLDDDSYSVNIHGGYRFNRYLAVEVKQVYLGSYDAVGNGSLVDEEFYGLTAAAVGILPITDSF